jgi:ribonuclease VapC
VSNCVLDASAVMALLRLEAGHQKVAEMLPGPPATIGTVNLSEVVARLADMGWREEAIRGAIGRLALDARPFDEELAYRAGLLRPLTRQAGLSFGDRACLALAQQLGLPAVTADRAWTTLRIPITVQVIR